MTWKRKLSHFFNPFVALVHPLLSASCVTIRLFSHQRTDFLTASKCFKVFKVTCSLALFLALFQNVWSQKQTKLFKNYQLWTFMIFFSLCGLCTWNVWSYFCIIFDLSKIRMVKKETSFFVTKKIAKITLGIKIVWKHQYNFILFFRIVWLRPCSIVWIFAYHEKAGPLVIFLNQLCFDCRVRY